MSDAQLELLFDAPAPTGAAIAGESRETGPESASQGGSGTPFPPAAANGRAGGALYAAIPATCPVVGKPVCYRGDCRWYQGGGCAHPEATAKPLRSRRLGVGAAIGADAPAGPIDDRAPARNCARFARSCAVSAPVGIRGCLGGPVGRRGRVTARLSLGGGGVVAPLRGAPVASNSSSWAPSATIGAGSETRHGALGAGAEAHEGEQAVDSAKAGAPALAERGHEARVAERRRGAARSCPNARRRRRGGRGAVGRGLPWGRT